jgi:hypothetical protein
MNRGPAELGKKPSTRSQEQCGRTSNHKEDRCNHLLKNILYFAVGTPTAPRFFPAPVCKMPSDIVFKLTGMAQQLLAPVAAAGALTVLRREASDRHRPRAFVQRHKG